MVLLVIIITVAKLVILNQIHFNMLQAQLSTRGMTNPARNIVLFSELYKLPLDHFITFFVFGAYPGIVFYFFI